MKKPNLYVLILGLILLMAIAASPLLFSSGPSEHGALSEGDHFKRISATAITDERAVMFFWYGCPHCLKTYEAMDAADFNTQIGKSGIVLHKIPVVANQTWELHARLFYALDDEGLSHEGHMQIMELIQRLGASTDSGLRKVVGRVVRDEPTRNPEFSATVDSIMNAMSGPKVSRRLNKDKLLTNQSSIQGVPAIVVDGQFLVTLSGSVRYRDIPTIIRHLLDAKTQ